MIKTILKVTLVIVAVALIILQFFQIEKANPPIVATETAENVLTVPENVNAILERSCADCHSHNTVYPWYSYVQPVGWFLRDHIDHGREHLNLSIYNTYSLKKQAHKLEEVCEQVESGEMPLPSYLWIHRESVLSDTDKTTLCDWSKGEKARLDSLIASSGSN